MLGLLAWIGLGVFSLTLAYDFWNEWFGPRLLSQPWFPREPDLPPVAGDVDEPKSGNYRRVVLAGYFTGSGLLIIGLLDVSPVRPVCLPYADFVKTYVLAALSLATGFMWFSEGQNVVMPYHKGIRYTIGVIAVLLPVYMAACGSGVL
jgi:hypothetical protein